MIYTFQYLYEIEIDNHTEHIFEGSFLYDYTFQYLYIFMAL